MPQSSFVKIINGRPVIDPGAMRHRVNLLAEAQGVPKKYDSAGAVRKWATAISNVPAAVEIRTGTDVVREGQTTTELLLFVAMWHQPGVASNMRVEALNGTYVVRAVENVMEMDLVLELACVGLGGQS